MEIKFTADSNVGKLAKWLRIMGYDAQFFKNIEDDRLLEIALKEERVVLTRDTQIMNRRVVSNGQLRTILLQSDDPEEQLQQVVKELDLKESPGQFTRCLECNQSLISRTKEEVKDQVPPYVFRTQSQYMQCPTCHRIYWRGTHWQKMHKKLEKLIS
jgi:uncharacterized protein with PIN domain